jgi:hypothetical protein
MKTSRSKIFLRPTAAVRAATTLALRALEHLLSPQLLRKAFPLRITERGKRERARHPCARLGLEKKRKVLESLVFAAFPS